MLKWVMIFLEWIISLKCPYVRKYLVYIFVTFFNHSVIELQAEEKKGFACYTISKWFYQIFLSQKTQKFKISSQGFSRTLKS